MSIAAIENGDCDGLQPSSFLLPGAPSSDALATNGDALGY